MARTRNRHANRIVALARELEEAQAAYTEAQARVDKLQARLLRAVESGAAGTTSRRRRSSAKNGSPTRGKRGRTIADWASVRERVLASMKKGALYTGGELEKMAGVTASAGTFISNVRDELVASKAIKKVTADKKPWKKGMSPRSVRWLRA